MSLKKIFKGIGKSFKKFAKSSLGKAVLIGAAIWVGGSLLAGKGLPWATKAGAETAAAATGQGATAAADVAATGGTMGSATTVPVGATVDAAAAAPAADVAIGAMPEAGMKQMMLESGGLKFMANLPDAAGAAQAGGGLLSKLGGAAKWMGNNPIPTLVAGNMIQGFAQPDPYEEWVKQQQYERRNSSVAGVYGDGRAVPISVPGSGLLSRANRAYLPEV